MALAICRETADIDVDVYESAPAFSDVGAGLVLWPRIIEIMLQWGLKKELEQYLSPAPGGSKGMRPVLGQVISGIDGILQTRE